MTPEKFKSSVAETAPPQRLTTPLAALWWDAKGDWRHAHGLVDELETAEGMAVHAYLHRKEGVGVQCGLLVLPSWPEISSANA